MLVLVVCIQGGEFHPQCVTGASLRWNKVLNYLIIVSVTLQDPGLKQSL